MDATVAPAPPSPARLSPINQRRLENFKANRRGFWSFWIFGIIFFLSMFAELIANDKPYFVWYDGDAHFPAFVAYAETEFGGEFATEADYRDEFVIELIEEKGWMLMPLIPYSFDTPVTDLPTPAPSPPTFANWLGTDDQARDVTARLIYGFRISVLFGVTLTVLASIVGVIAGAVQGYYGGWIDLGFQRFIEVWEGARAVKSRQVVPALSNWITTLRAVTLAAAIPISSCGSVSDRKTGLAGCTATP